ncbi:unnamed protein product, partial [Prorocentrum cordatum]
RARWTRPPSGPLWGRCGKSSLTPWRRTTPALRTWTPRRSPCAAAAPSPRATARGPRRRGAGPGTPRTGAPGCARCLRRPSPARPGCGARAPRDPRRARPPTPLLRLPGAPGADPATRPERRPQAALLVAL